MTDTIATLTAQLQAQRKGALQDRLRAVPDKPRPVRNVDDPGFWRRFEAQSGVVEGHDDAEPVKAQPATRKRKVDAVGLAKRAQEAGLPVASVLATPDGGALLTFKSGTDVDADHIETADELRALI